VCQFSSIHFIYDMVILKLLQNYQLFKKEVIYVEIKIRVYVWIDYCFNSRFCRLID
jgi:hypothetical protein